MIEEQDFLVYLDSPLAEQLVEDTGLSGQITRGNCKMANNNCLMLVEANFGADKANYFVRRSIRLDQVISKGGDVDTTMIIKWRNESPNASWPGGPYKNYLRWLLPEGAKLREVDLGDKRTASISGTLTAAVLAAIPPDQFLVFQSSESGYLSYGTLINIPVQEERILKIVYRSPFKLDFTKTQQDYTITFLKQPGVEPTTVDFALDYPSFLRPVMDSPEKGVSVLALPQKLIYNMDLAKDRTITVKFKR
ncbi:hypothetical protein HY440_00150 [Candidatus Microgenomates bacterium]|nr:hypothetical protein [Candidatus Microgenomates bacterium]